MRYNITDLTSGELSLKQRYVNSLSIAEYDEYIPFN